MAQEKYMPVSGQPIVFTDLETTGFSVDKHKIIEIGAVVTNYELDVIDEIDIKVWVDKEHIDEIASPSALEVNGYTSEAWAEAMDLREAMEIYSEKTVNATFVAHNAGFDWKFLERAFVDTHIENTLAGHRIDNLRFSRHVLKGVGLSNFTQATVAQHLGIEPEPKIHRAVNGARLAHAIYKKLFELSS
jgi:DNA polymerase III epsilon subunit-like protein